MTVEHIGDGAFVVTAPHIPDGFELCVGVLSLEQRADLWREAGFESREECDAWLRERAL